MTHRIFTQKNMPKQNDKGFTLIETLVAITVLMVVIVVPLTVAYSGIKQTRFVKGQLTSTFLAQDSLEYVISKRRQNAINGNLGSSGNNNWLAGFRNGAGNNGCLGGRYCWVDSTNTSISSSSTDYIVDSSNNINDVPTLEYCQDTGLFGYGTGSCDSGWEATHFTRYIQIEELVSGQEARVTAVVNWSKGSSKGSVTIHTNVFNTAF